MRKTRAEAIAVLQKMPIRTTDFDEAHKWDGLDAVQLAIAALRGPSREAVERVWLSAPNTRLAVEQLEGGGTRYSAVNTCTACGQETPIGHFCHNCGAALDLTGVSLVLDRLQEVMGP